MIELDVERRRLHLEVSDEELKRRRSAWKAADVSGVARLHEAVLRSRAASRQGRRSRLPGRRQRLGDSQRQSLSCNMRALITDYDFPDIELEREVFRTGGVDLVEAQCKSEDDLIAAARECDALLLQYAPVTDRVLAALPRIGLVSRYGAGFDTIDTEACRRHGVWVANSPDYGVGEVATHALAMTLALIRHSGALRPRRSRRQVALPVAGPDSPRERHDGGDPGAGPHRQALCGAGARLFRARDRVRSVHHRWRFSGVRQTRALRSSCSTRPTWCRCMCR